jgi:hypothetical protein
MGSDHVYFPRGFIFAIASLVYSADFIPPIPIGSIAGGGSAAIQ